VERKVIIYAIIASSLWGLSFPITKLGLKAISPILFAFLRYLLASFLFLLLAIMYENFFAVDYKYLTIFGMVSVTLPVTLQNIGLKYTSAYISGFIQSTGPIYTLILAYVFLNEEITKHKLVGLALAITGTYFIVSPKGGGDLLGNLLVLASAISYSIGGIMAKSLLNKNYHPIQIIAFATFFGTIFLAPLTFIEKTKFSMASIPFILFLAIFPTFISYILWYSAMEKLEVSKLSFFVYLIPIFSLLSSYILLKEEVKLLTIFAGFIVIIGIAIAQKA